jgi:hypothetical protein
MLVFSYAVELDATNAQADGYADLLNEAIRAYRARAKCQTSRLQLAAAEKDLKRAETLEAKLKKTSEEAREGTSAIGANQVVIQNDWAEVVTITIAGVSYEVPPGKAKTLPARESTFTYEMIAGPHRVSGTIEAGKSYRVKPPPQSP